jgi:hypothetical protein
MIQKVEKLLYGQFDDEREGGSRHAAICLTSRPEEASAARRFGTDANEFGNRRAFKSRAKKGQPSEPRWSASTPVSRARGGGRRMTLTISEFKKEQTPACDGFLSEMATEKKKREGLSADERDGPRSESHAYQRIWGLDPE